jgi:predicted acyl esterase
MKTITTFPRKTVEHPDIGIVMPDGCRLSARVWMPEDAGKNPVPAILEHLPYRKRDGTTYRDCLTHPWFAGHGYACIRVDMRGNGDSQGLMEDEYTEQELQDACDVIAWAASQPWCNGNVGMMGISWGGFNSLQVAAKQPSALKAVITLCSTVDRYADDIHYKGGCLLNENFGWASTMLSYSSRPPDPAIVGESWREMWLERLENQPFLLKTWLAHQARDAYWKRGSICEDFAAIQAAVLSIGGWHDGYRNTVANLVEGVKAPVKGIIGPWIHKYPHYAAPEPRIGFLQEALRWWDCWLKGVDTGVENDPAYRAWLMDSVRPARWHDARPGRWIAEAAWPSPRIATRAIDLLDRGAEPVIVASRQDCGLEGGEYFPFTFGPELPGDQRGDDALSACFDLPPLTEPIDVVGAAQLEIAVRADRPQANIAVRLCDVHPDGASELISYGLLNLTHHASHERPQALIPGAQISATVTRSGRLSHPGGAPAARGDLDRLLADDLAVARTRRADTEFGKADASREAARYRRRNLVSAAGSGGPLAHRATAAGEFRTASRPRPEDRRRHARDRRRFRRSPRSRAWSCDRRHSPRNLDDRSRRSPLGAR